MAGTGKIAVPGRYKDIINRAGENISPSVIERVLIRMEGIQSSQFISVPDEIPGEVPVAVINLTQDSTISKSLLHERLANNLGTAFALERVIDLRELAIDQCPVTATGKVRKVGVRKLEIDYLNLESKQFLAQGPTAAALTRI